MTAPGTRRHIYDTKLGTDKCDNSSMSLQMGYTQGANQSGQVFGLGRQIYDPKYCPQGTVADGAPSGAGDCPDPGRSQNIPLTTRRRPATEAPSTLSSHIVSPSGFWVFLCFHLCVFLSRFSAANQPRVCEWQCGIRQQSFSPLPWSFAGLSHRAVGEGGQGHIPIRVGRVGRGSVLARSGCAGEKRLTGSQRFLVASPLPPFVS